MAGLPALSGRASEEGLAVLGAFHPQDGDGAPAGTGTIVLLGPEPGRFWRSFSGSPEYRDGRPDPLDRWSERVIGAMAAAYGAEALFPFGGPPYAPFLAWARRSGVARSSPVGLLVHARLGLFVSYRGALALTQRLALDPLPARPCDSCPAPCLDACPAGALGAGGYEVAACRLFLNSPAGAECLRRGCAVRRACPVRTGVQPVAQTAFHMTAFHGRQEPCDS